MSWDQPLPEALQSDPLFLALAARLRDHGYSEQALSALLGIEAPSVRSRKSRDQLTHRLREDDGELSVLARLFFLGDQVDVDDLAFAFDHQDLQRLTECAVLHGADPSGTSVRALIGISPCRGRLVLSDSLALNPESVYGLGGPAMGPGPDSETLLRTTPRRKVRRVLDLCTGPGTHALVAAGHADTVIGLDIAPRALAFARANARLNETPNVRFVQGDLAAGPGSDGIPPQTYDLVLANPPFVPNVHDELLYRDGGGDLGDRVLNAIIAALPRLLSDTGQARIITDVAFRDGESLETKLQALLGGALERLDVLCFEDAPFALDGYAEFHSVRLIEGQMVQEPAAARALLAHYEQLEIARVAPVLLAFKRVPDAPGRLRVARVSGLLRLTADDIDRLFDFWDALRAGGAEAVAMEGVPTPRPDVSVVYRRRLSGDQDESFQIAFDEDSPWPTSRTNAELFDLLTSCDGKRTGRDLAEIIAERRGASAEQVSGFVTHAVVSLVEFGVLEVRARPPTPQPAPR